MFWTAFREIVDPTGVFFRDSANLYLTKDLFFSGHTATTLLVFLYFLPFRRLRWVALALHLVVVASLFFGHIHYTIDVIGAWAITFALFALREGWPKP
jgi:membrane-associated phospholipid phosphatase